jgi:hypothetical protein
MIAMPSERRWFLVLPSFGFRLEFDASLTLETLQLVPVELAPATSTIAATTSYVFSIPPLTYSAVIPSARVEDILMRGCARLPPMRHV